MKLTGIIDYSMGNFLCVRGFASMFDLAKVSEADPEIQRSLIDDHRGEMEQFLSSGEFTFFSEVILCNNMLKDEANEVTVNLFRDSVRKGENFKKTRISDKIYSSTSHAKHDPNNPMILTGIQRIIIEFDEHTANKFLRIDGNHRLSAVSEQSSYKAMQIPFCLLLFRDTEETDKFCRALFHNINTKQRPLKMEENLKVIIESKTVFTNTLLNEDTSFGPPYLFTRIICDKIDLCHFPLIKQFIGTSKYTYFVGLFEHLLKEGLIPKNKSAVEIIVEKLSDINTALRESHITNITENIAVLGAMTFYKIQDDAKYKCFIKWINKNNIGSVEKLHIDDVISIYNSVYDNLPKKVFLARWYPESGDALEEANGRLTVVKRIVAELGLELVDLGSRGGGTYSIRELIDKEIPASDIFIADLTGNRPNVMAEVGYALSHLNVGRTLFYFKSTEDAEKVPFDLSGFRYEPISDSNSIDEKVKPKLQEILKEIAEGMI